MKEYRYSLDKSSKKFICPKCLKRSFVKYIETESNNYLSDEFGRCDRETNCSYYFTPKAEYQTLVTTNTISPLKPSFHDYTLLKRSKSNYTKNDFIQFLKSIFSDVEVTIAIEKYHIGTSNKWKGSTVFWQIDNYNQIRAGKILKYNQGNGKRAKDENGKALISWVRSILKKNKIIKDYNLKQCLFGLQLVNKETQGIALVESEKTAIIMSLFKPQYTWLSTGSKQGFKLEYLEPIKNYNIVAFPDNGEFKDWNNTAKELNKLGFKIKVNNGIENLTQKTGNDLADFFIENIESKFVPSRDP